MMSGNRERAQRPAPAVEGRLLSTPKQPTEAGGIGLMDLGLDLERDGLLFVPDGYRPEQPAPFALMLHGAGGNARQGMGLLQHQVNEAGLIVLAPDSRLQTWDMLIGGYGVDVAFIDQALAHTFERYAVDPQRLAIGGFSDGASYALSLGITNGLLFTHILAFSPGFVAPAAQRDKPRIYVSHGTRDAVLPINSCSRRVVPILQDAGYDVRYHEFEGPHTVPPEIAREALDWFVGT